MVDNSTAPGRPSRKKRPRDGNQAISRNDDLDPFWTWGWRGAPWWRRIWLSYRMVKPVVAFAGVIAAIILLVEVVPKVYAPIGWRTEEYTSLREIHAGYELDYVSERLGSPALVRRAVNDDGASFRELIYDRNEHFVQVVVDEDDRVLLYAVTSCDADFQPTFDAGEGIEVQLQRRTLQESAQPVDTWPKVDFHVTVSDLENSRDLHYRTGLTGSSPEFFIEMWGGAISHRFRAYYIAINTLCLQESELDRVALVDYVGDTQKAPAEVQSIRKALAANTYAETAPEVDYFLSDEGQIIGLNSSVGPDGFWLPPNFEGTGNTRVP